MQPAVAFEWEDGSITRFEKGDNGSWYADGLQPMSPAGMIQHVSLWVEGTYRVPREGEKK